VIINFIGDLHGHYSWYHKFIRKLPDNEYSFQIGDFGFSYNSITCFPVHKHVMLPGNHDNYDIIKWCNNALKLYGLWNTIFYVRGAWSIDRKYRTQGIDWWSEEELDIDTLNSAIDYYKKIKPEYMVTHEAPLSLVDQLVDPSFAKDFGYSETAIKTKTNQALQTMFEIHQPKVWIFGHYHVARRIQVENTQFICLDMVPRDGSVLRLEI
jgi:Icc-related predicted phosphoesterase